MHAGPVIAVSDLDRAREFYEGGLGLAGEPTPGGWLLHADDGTVIYLLAGFSDAGTASWPVASFRVVDVRATVRELRSRGIAFLGPAELPFELDDDGVSADTAGVQVAWLRDPDGSVLTVFSRTAG
ncbi:VOC family protein [Actinocatenispora sera]|jgi:catechol 2,3-dioxygenase-like lactoylglutathione lyase family enzyme|uniref:Glyoxalase n=1 Tax=Actinocatenispora sera TaxID=390989 RepID=A0A810L380_9ACTN|nr:VOC family protein [Actinocatenispora sera]BCJ28851.1 glyoxalase [Actinocatenispora sera]